MVAPVERLGQLTVLNVELDGRAIGNLAHVEVQVLPFPRLEEENIVAVVELGQLVELVQLRLGIELGVFATVGYHRGQVVQEMALPTRGE